MFKNILLIVFAALALYACKDDNSSGTNDGINRDITQTDEIGRVLQKDEDDWRATAHFSNMLFYPNPIFPNSHPKLAFTIDTTAICTIWITNKAGLYRKLSDTLVEKGDREFLLLGTFATGMYRFHIATAGDTAYGDIRVQEPPQ